MKILKFYSKTLFLLRKQSEVMKLIVLLILSVFQLAEKQCPSLPTGLLEAISYTNTQCHHLTDADYTFPVDDPSAMPRAYGMMGLVKDGKGCFRENLKTVAQLSGFSIEEIMNDPAVNVLAYAKACEKMAVQMEIRSHKAEDYMPVIEALSELPLSDDKDELPMKMMLYSVYQRLGSDLKALFGDDYALLSGETVSISRETDYPGAVWIPAPPCNYEERTKEVSAVVIHYTEGSYAGCISWFQNCDAQVSAHYVIRSSDGQVTQMVREKDKAWHARSANGYTIGIEHEAYGDIISFFTEAMYQSSADLVRNICLRYEAINGYRTFCTDTLDNGTALDSGLHNLGGEGACIQVRGHQHYPDQTHTDPGPYWCWDYYYKLINNRILPIQLGGIGVDEGDLNYENYGNDERRVWVIRCDEGKRITLTFDSFDLEADYDFLWIYDGDNVFSPKLGRWNTSSPGSVTSSGNVLCVEFRSDCLTTASGWRAHWMAATPAHVDTIVVKPEECFEIFPNPVGDELNLLFKEEGFHDVTITDVTGRVVYKHRFLEDAAIDVSGWSKGVYTVTDRLVRTCEVTIKRFIR